MSKDISKNLNELQYQGLLVDKGECSPPQKKSLYNWSEIRVASKIVKRS